MPKKRSPKAPEAEQLVFPYQLRVGDVIEDEGRRGEAVERPTGGAGGGKMTRAWVRYEEGGRSLALWDSWRKIRVVRRSTA